MPATRQKLEQGAQSRQQLLDATIALLGEKGYSGVSIDAIVRRSGVVRSGIYWHFGSKNALVLAALQHETDRWVVTVREAVQAAESPQQQLDLLLGYVRRAVLEPNTRAMVFSLLLERGRVDDACRGAIRAAFATLRETLADGFATALPVVPRGHLKTIADAFVDTADGLFLRTLLEDDEARLDAALAELRRATLLRLSHEVARAARKSRAERES